MVLLRERPQVRVLHQPVTLRKARQAPLALQEVSPEVSLVEDSSPVSSSSSRVQARQDSKWVCRDSKWVSQASTPDKLLNSTKPAFKVNQASNPRFPVSSLSREGFPVSSLTREVSLGSRVRVGFQASRHSLEAFLGSKDSSHSMGNLGQVQASTRHNKVGLVVLEPEQGQPQVQDMALALPGLKDFSKKLK